jgi:ATP-binding protein involved in chromosome partitioning
MFGRHDTNVLGITENMATFQCPDCGSGHDIFGKGGGRAFAEENGMPFLGSIPLDPDVRTGGDEGEPAVLGEGETADAFRVVTENVANNVGVLHRRQQSQESVATAPSDD